METINPDGKANAFAAGPNPARERQLVFPGRFLFKRQLLARLIGSKLRTG